MMHTQVMQDALDEATDSWGVKVGSDNEIKMVSFLKCHEANGLGNMARWWHAHKMMKDVIMAKVIMTMAAKICSDEDVDMWCVQYIFCLRRQGNWIGLKGRLKS